MSKADQAGHDAVVDSVKPPVRPWQAGMTNAELTDAWCKKVPGVVPTERELSAFALGSEVGFERAQNLERYDWSRVHHALAKHGEHPGRTDDHLADVIDRMVARLKTPNVLADRREAMKSAQEPKT